MCARLRPITQPNSPPTLKKEVPLTALIPWQVKAIKQGENGDLLGLAKFWPLSLSSPGISVLQLERNTSHFTIESTSTWRLECLLLCESLEDDQPCFTAKEAEANRG